MKFLSIIISICCLIFAKSTLAQTHPFKPFSMENTSKYGGYCFYHQLQTIFDYKVDTSSIGIKNIEDNYENNTALVLVSKYIVFSNKELNSLMSYVDRGNHVFLSGLLYDENLLNRLDIDVPGFDFERLKDSTIIKVNPKVILPFVNNNQYTLKPSFINNKITMQYDRYNTTKLGFNNKQETNYIKISKGKGFFYIHTAPFAFCNQFLLKDSNYTYLETIMSHIPKNVHKVYYDEHQYYFDPSFRSSGSSSGGGDGSSNPLPNNLNGSSEPPEPPGALDYILGNPNLKAAFYLSLAAILLGALFAALRKQRAIPVVPPVRNNSKELVHSITDLYLNQHDNKVIADKKIRYFHEVVRTKFNIQDAELNNEFWGKLQTKTNMDDVSVQKLRTAINTCNSEWNVNNGQLVGLSNELEKFYKI